MRIDNLDTDTQNKYISVQNPLSIDSPDLFLRKLSVVNIRTGILSVGERSGTSNFEYSLNTCAKVCTAHAHDLTQILFEENCCLVYVVGAIPQVDICRHNRCNPLDISIRMCRFNLVNFSDYL